MVTNQDRSEHLWVENLENALARPGQRLLDHVNGTIEKITFLGDFYELDKDIVEMTVLSAIFHDIGKLKKAFQKGLIEGTPLPPHSPSSACHVFSIWFVCEKGCFRNQSIILNVVYSHHGYPKDFWEGSEKDIKTIIIEKLSSECGCLAPLKLLREYLEKVDDKGRFPVVQKIKDALSKLKGEEWKEYTKFWTTMVVRRFFGSHEVELQTVYDVLSLLKTADRYDAASEELHEKLLDSSTLVNSLYSVERRIKDYLSHV